MIGKKREDFEENSESEDEYSLEELYKKLITYKNNLFKIDTLISVETDEDKTKKYQKLRTSLVQAINYQEEAIKLAEEDGADSWSTERVIPEYIDRVCRAWYAKDERWYHAQIDEVNADAQTVNVSWVGYNITSKLHAIHVRMLPIPELSKLQQGQLCEGKLRSWTMTLHYFSTNF